MAHQTATIRTMTPGCGAEVLGVDLANPSNSDMETIRAAYRDYGVIFFRDQKLTPEQHIA
ncbi:MAG: TauD/TfdA family dioxygenase, partial [Rhodocyclaceae bacterium]|nr:TauD/TfdA family dioxygenase [Rhodocyclaceae bacterium]